MFDNGLIHPHLNYIACVYAYNGNNILQKLLQSYQNKALKIVYNFPRTPPTIYRSVCRTILPICGLHKYQVLLFVFKSVHGLASEQTINFTTLQVHQLFYYLQSLRPMLYKDNILMPYLLFQRRLLLLFSNLRCDIHTL